MRESPTLEIPFINRYTISPIPGPSRVLRTMSHKRNDLSEPDITTPTTTSPSCHQLVSSPIRRLRYKKDKEISNLKQIIINMKRQNERYRKQLHRFKTIKKENSTVSSLTLTKPKKNIISTKTEIELFFEDDENSRLCSGRKEFIVRKKIRKQKRYLNDSLLNLHKKFLKTSNFTTVIAM
ncbi:unnamed protein product [Chilo suppressalis]|uniref:Uncharacterized protein n=1 Tax=Chilo suppressalis TaxID=168631 RepID=A0ABN8ASP3_CHISP|nr:unnamed protein product [Chilo suppressalis]